MPHIERQAVRRLFSIAIDRLALAVAIGAWVSSVVFDGLGHAAHSPGVYARGAHLLVGIGLAGALYGGAVRWLRAFDAYPSGRRSPWLQRALMVDAAVVVASLSLLVRRSIGFTGHDAVPWSLTLGMILAILLTIAGDRPLTSAEATDVE